MCAQLLSHVLLVCNPVDCSPPGSSVHGILQARILEWAAISFSRGSSQPREPTLISCFAGRFFTVESWGKPWKGCMVKFSLPPFSFFDVDFFQSLSNLLNNIPPVLYFFFFAYEACRILAARPEMEPEPLALEARVLTTGSPAKFLSLLFPAPISLSWWNLVTSFLHGHIIIICVPT